MMHGRDRSVKVPVGELTLNVQCSGIGTPVLLLHGFPDQHSLWREVSPRLVAAGHRVIAPDLRRFGESDAPAGRAHYTIDRILADLALEWFGDQAPRGSLTGSDILL